VLHSGPVYSSMSWSTSQISNVKTSTTKLTDVLHDVIAELVLHQVVGLRDDLADQSLLLRAMRMVNAALQHATAMAMASNGQCIQSNSLEDEVRIRRAEVVQTLLDDMVAIEVLNEANDVLGQCFNDGLGLLRALDGLNHLLESPSSMLVFGNLNHERGSLVDKDRTLLGGAMLKELLAQVVSEGILHQLDNMVLDFGQDDGDHAGLWTRRKSGPSSTQGRRSRSDCGPGHLLALLDVEGRMKDTYRRSGSGGSV
jgi:hypothetical protein